MPERRVGACSPRGICAVDCGDDGVCGAGPTCVTITTTTDPGTEDEASYGGLGCMPQRCCSADCNRGQCPDECYDLVSDEHTAIELSCR